MKTLSLAVALTALTSFAQGFDLERVTLNPGARETWLAQTGDGLERSQLRVSLLGHYQHDPLVYSVDGQRAGALVGSRWTAHLLAAFGVLEYLEVQLQVPLVLTQSGDLSPSYGLAAVQSTALGAPILALRSTLLRQRKAQPIDLAVSLGVALPLGSTAALTRDPGAGLAFLPTLGAGRTFGVIRLGAELGLRMRQPQTLSPESSQISDEIGPEFSGAFVVSTGTLPIPLHAELAARVFAPFTHAPASLEVLAAVRYTLLEQLELSVLGGPGIGKSPGTPAYRLLFGVSWTPQF